MGWTLYPSRISQETLSPQRHFLVDGFSFDACWYKAVVGYNLYIKIHY